MNRSPVRLTASLSVGLALGAGLLVGCSSEEEPDSLPSGAPTGPASTATPAPAESESPTTATNGRPRVVATIADGLEVPWGIGFLPDGTALVTERDSGRVLAVTSGQVSEVGTVDQAAPQGEAGLLGIAVSPSYAEDHAVFLYVTTASDNRIVRTTYDGTRLGELEVILDGIPNGFIHDGGRLAFGPDGYLYASTGETGEPELAQDLDSLGGKILRITPDGDPPPGNPFDDSPVWSWGHRNVQGLAFDDDGRLWASEFGASDFDELNLIVKGANYGWPLVEGTGGNGRYAEPEVVWRTSEASPSGLAFAGGRLWLGALKGERLWRVDADGRRAERPTDFFVGDYGRLRTVVVAPDGHLWVTTSNRDGRGDPGTADDRILEITP
ncbi:putative aldose sugar dehydrogenase [metagenome]|uniref:Putative aldose sugar dehydrogenase n=1 Tax=metagenome TaxID=256318 RepID=A0A2P2C380_9ZZZZ